MSRRGATVIKAPARIAGPAQVEAAGQLLEADHIVIATGSQPLRLAGEWIHQAALAIRAQIPIRVLLDQVAQFPTYTEAYLAALEQLGP
jgi:pyruvate/2-oxoglutarate dehydrogenase complex dihydrolipoamide dehydrogenase (E3) component